MVRFLFRIPIMLIRYFCLGIFFTFYTVIDFIVSLIFILGKYVGLGIRAIVLFFLYILKYAVKGFIVLSRICYHFLHYALFGISVPFIFIYNAYVRYAEKAAIRAEARREKEEKLKEVRRLEKERQLAEKREKQKRENDVYINEKVKIERKTFGDRINDFLLAIIAFPKKMVANIKKKYNNSSFVKARRNRKDINRNVLLIDFDGEDAEKSPTKLLYEYEAKDPDGKIVKGYFEAYSKVEVHSFLLSEGYEVYSIKTDKWIRFLHQSSATSHTKVKTKDLIFFLTQLSTYIKAGIPLVESLKILSRQFKSKAYQRIFKLMIYDLTMGENFSTAMEKQGKAFPALLINMIKTSEMTGSLPEVLDDMAEYYTEMDKTRKEMITAMTYPSIVLVVAIAVVTFIMIYVIPQFVEIYESMDAAQIPGITIAIMNLSDFLQHNLWLVILIIALVIGVFAYLYHNVKLIRTATQWLLMHLPIFGNIIIYNEVTTFTKTFASLLEHNVFITDSMDILNKITNNEIYKMLILDTITNLAKGEKISTAFKDHWAFPMPAYEMLVTGERTGELPQMMKKVSEYYQDLHKNAVTRVKTFIEPVLILFLTVVVGIIILSIVIPMFNMYTAIQEV